MTESQREVYILLCMAGRSEEAEQYKNKCKKSNEPIEQEGESPRQMMAE